MSRIYDQNRYYYGNDGRPATPEQRLRDQEDQFLRDTEMALDELLQRQGGNAAYSTIVEHIIRAKIELMSARTRLAHVVMPKRCAFGMLPNECEACKAGTHV